MEKKKTFAFISYSRSDRAVAIDLHKRIEKYAYPKEWVAEANYPYDDKFVRSIFLDLTDLSVQARDFTEEIRERLTESRYLIVICTQHSAKSEFVQREINYFLSTHDNNADLICAVYVDKIFNGMHPVIDEIVASRNCPIYVTGEGDAGHTGRKYCFNHILEFLLKVEFAKLYNRYEEYKRKKLRRRMVMMALVLAFLFGLMAWGLIAETRRASIEHARVRFERGIFPYALVVGYVQNFLVPDDESPERLLVRASGTHVCVHAIRLYRPRRHYTHQQIYTVPPAALLLRGVFHGAHSYPQPFSWSVHHSPAFH